MSYILDFRVQPGDASPLRNIADAVQRVKSYTGTTTQELKVFDAAMKHAMESGRSFASSLNTVERAMKSAGQEGVARFTNELKTYIREQERAASVTEASARRQVVAMQGLARIGGAGLPGGMGLSSGLVGTFGAGAGVAAAVAAVSAGILKLANDTGQYAREQENLAARTGLTTQQTQLFTQMAQVSGVHVNALTTAMRTLSKGMAENSQEGKMAKEALRELGLSASVAFQPMDRALPQILERLGSLSDAMERDRLAIELFGRGGLELLPLAERFRELEPAIRAAGAAMTEEGIKKAADYQREIALLTLKWQELKRELGQKAIGIVEFIIHGPFPWANRGWKDVQDRKGLGVDQIGGLGAPRPDFPDPFGIMREERANRVQSILRGGAGRLGRQEALQYDLRDAEASLQAAVNNPNSSDASVRAANARVIAIKEAIKGLQEYKSLLEQVQEREQRAALSPFGKVGEIEAQRRNEINRIQSSNISASQKSNLIQRTNALYGRDLALAAQDEGARNRERGVVADEGLRKADNDRMANIFDRMTGGMRELISQSIREFEHDTATDRAVRNVGLGAEREDILRRGQRASRMVGLQFSGPGNEKAQIQAAYQVRLQLAQQLFDLEIRTSNQEGDDDKRRIDQAKAYADLRKEQQDAELDREMAMLEVQKKRLEEFKSLAVDFVHAAQSHNLGGFFRQQGQRIEDTIIGNAAGMIFPKVAGALGGTNMSPDSTIGKLLKGTPFGPKQQDENAMQTRANTLATIDNTTALGGVISAITGQPAPAAGGTGGLSVSAGGILGTGGGIASLGSIISSLGGGGGVRGSNNTPSESPFSYIPGFGDAGASSGGSGSSSGSGGSMLGTVFNSSASVGSRVGAGVGLAAQGYQGVSSIVSGIKQGGAKGTTNAIAGGLDIAAMVPGPQQPFVMAAAMVTHLISSILGDPKQIRQDAINKTVERNQFYDPVKININRDVGGGLADYDRFGTLRSSNLSPYPTVEQPYYLFQQHTLVPGRTDSNFGGPGPGAPNAGGGTVIINAMDPASFRDFALRNSDVFADATNHGIDTHGGTSLIETLRERM